MKLSIKVKCVDCEKVKEVGEEQKEMPMCDSCGSPMIVVSSTLTNKQTKKR